MLLGKHEAERKAEILERVKIRVLEASTLDDVRCYDVVYGEYRCSGYKNGQEVASIVYNDYTDRISITTPSIDFTLILHP